MAQSSKTVVAKLERELDKLTTHTDGVCDLCGLPVDEHPSSVHRAAALSAKIQADLNRQAEQWGVPSVAIIDGVL